jgi:hypothetical protein
MGGPAMYVELLEVVRGRVDRFVATGDAEEVLDPLALRDARVLLEVAPRPAAGRLRPGPYRRWCDAAHAVGLLHLARRAVIGPIDGRADDDTARSLLDATGRDLPHLDEQLQGIERAARGSAPGDLPALSTLTFHTPIREVDDVIAAIRRELREGSADELGLRMRLADAQLFRFGRTTALADLDAAIETVRAVVAATATDEPWYAARVWTFGEHVVTRYNYSQDVVPAAADVRAAVSATPVERRHGPGYQANLGLAHVIAYLTERDEDDLHRARECLRAALEGEDGPAAVRAERLTMLAYAHGPDAVRTRNVTELDAAIEVARQAVDASDRNRREYFDRLVFLADKHHIRFLLTDNPDDLRAVHTLTETVIREAPAGHPVTELARMMRAARLP